MPWRNRLMAEVIVPVSIVRRTGGQIQGPLDEAILEAGEAYPRVWPRGLMTRIAEDHGVQPAKVHQRRRLLLPGSRSARGGWSS